MTLRCFLRGSHFMGRLSSPVAPASRAPPFYDGRHTNERTLFSKLTISPPSRGASVEVTFACSAPAGVCGVRVLCSSVLACVCRAWTRVSCVALTRAMCAARSCRKPARTCDSCVRSLNGYKNTGTAPNLPPVCRAHTDTTNHGGLPLRRSQIVARTPRTTRSRRGPALARTL